MQVTLLVKTGRVDVQLDAEDLAAIWGFAGTSEMFEAHTSFVHAARDWAAQWLKAGLDVHFKEVEL